MMLKWGPLSLAAVQMAAPVDAGIRPLPACALCRPQPWHTPSALPLPSALQRIIGITLQWERLNYSVTVGRRKKRKQKTILQVQAGRWGAAAGPALDMSSSTGERAHQYGHLKRLGPGVWNASGSLHVAGVITACASAALCTTFRT